ncbi:hypothetical protein Asi02nite_07960 [Asanoa siamensis]|uniref:Arginase n=1 Tax=Asanoa siamensis TaxID=926357 RepID=A0ABQ4CJ39_9ACTN|nr:hypothetical protein Asi02nite_07960 [Asanoa siamensis]
MSAVRRIALLDAPSNLGLRPPTPTSTPGCAKAPGALRDRGLLGRLVARDAGCLTAPRYDAGDWRPGDGVAHAEAIAAYSVALAGRIGAIIDADEFPVVLGGDCSILLGSALAMHRLGEAVGGRIGLVYVDGHSDFRHPGNASYVGAAAGEGLALATGRGQADLAAIEGRRPYFRDVDVVVLGIRAQDEYRLDLQAAGILTRPVPALRAEGAARTAQWARDQLADCAGYWVHIDVDVLDPAVMPAVDAPDPGGIAFAELELLIAGLVDTPHCLGIELTVFDPDYDPDGAYAAEITSAVVAGLAPIRAAASARRASPLAFTPRRRPAPDGERFRPPISAVPDKPADSPPAPTVVSPRDEAAPIQREAAGPRRAGLRPTDRTATAPTTDQDDIEATFAPPTDRDDAGVPAAAPTADRNEAVAAGATAARDDATASTPDRDEAIAAGGGGAAVRDDVDVSDTATTVDRDEAIVAGTGAAASHDDVDVLATAATADRDEAVAADAGGVAADRDDAEVLAAATTADRDEAVAAGDTTADPDDAAAPVAAPAMTPADAERAPAADPPPAATEPTAGDVAADVRRPVIGRQRRSSFDILDGAAGPNRKRRSAADILSAPLGADTAGPGRLRRRTDGDAITTDVRPGGLRRDPDTDADGTDVRPGGLRRRPDPDTDADGTDVRPGGLRRRPDDDVDRTDVRPGGLRRRPPDPDE